MFLYLSGAQPSTLNSQPICHCKSFFPFYSGVESAWQWKNSKMPTPLQPAARSAGAKSLVKGQRYTWSEIVERTGADGSPPYYLLHRDGAVVAGCFTLELNPEAPLVVLAGKGPQVSELADAFCAQKGSIPVCVKSGMGEWQCCGNYKLVRSSTDPVEI